MGWLERRRGSRRQKRRQRLLLRKAGLEARVETGLQFMNALEKFPGTAMDQVIRDKKEIAEITEELRIMDEKDACCPPKEE